MRITSIELLPKNSANTKVLSFRDPRRLNPYNVKAISGLDADEIIPQFYGGSGSSKFYNMAMVSRQIVVRIQLNPRYNLNETPSSLRDDIYRLIASSRTGKLTLLFKDATTTKATLSGFIAKVDSDLSSEEPEVQLTIDCDSPFLQSPARTAVAGAVSLDPTLTVVTDNVSTAPHGAVFKIKLTASSASLKIEDPTDLTWSFEIIPATTFLANDIVTISSEANAKEVSMLRGVTTTQLADRVTPGGKWPLIFPGSNSFKVSPTADVDWTSIEYYETFWGV